MTKNYVTEQKMLPPSQGPFPSLPPSFLAIPLNRITFLVLTLLSVHFYDKKGIFLIRPFKEEITVDMAVLPSDIRAIKKEWT